MGKKRRKYRCWKPEDRAKIGKYGHLHGNKQAIVKYQSEFPDITHQSVTDFIKAYVEEKKKSKGAEVTELKKKKQGRPTLLPEELMKKTIDMVLNLRLKGAPVHASVINAVAKGIVLTNERSLLVENGGCISLNDDWARKILYQMELQGKKMVRRMATTAKIPIAPYLLSEVKLDFQRKFKSLKAWHNKPLDLIINFDQTPLPYVCSSNNTLEVKGKSSVPIKGKGKKLQITGTFAISMTGEFLPMQLIYGGKTPRCLPKNVEFPEGFNLTYSENHWSNEQVATEYLEEIIFPYINSTKERLGLPDTQKSMLIYDVFRGQKTDKVTGIIEDNDCVSLFVPSNLTDKFQMLDLNVNGHAKSFLNRKFEEWYANQIAKQLNSGLDIYEVDISTKLSVMKPTHARWLIGLYDYLRNKREMILKGFEMAGLTEALEIELPSENPYDDVI